jgi:nicotinate-nucleotide pyrophosphorylase
MVMLKDNYIWSAGSISKSVSAARLACGFSMTIEVESITNFLGQETVIHRFSGRPPTLVGK